MVKALDWTHLTPPAWATRLLTSNAVGWIALLGLCGAFIQGGIDKASDFHSAILEMQRFGVAPPAPIAAATIVTELGGSALILTGIYRWVGALWLAGFTVVTVFVASRFWESPLPARAMMENTFFEHFGLVGGFLYVAWNDLRSKV